MLGRGRKKIELPIEEIVKKWEQGVTQKELSKEYGVSDVTIRKRISEYYEKEEKEKPKKKIELPIEEIVKKWEQGVTQKELSKEYGVSDVTIRKRISEYYEKEEKEKPKKKIELPIEEIVKKWEQGVTQKELSKEYGVSDVTIRKRISEYYEKEEKEKPKKKIELPIEEIVKKWEQGVTQKELSKEYGVSDVTIRKRISEYYEKEEKKKTKQRIELQIKEIVKRWEQGTTQKKLSKEYGVSRVTISKRISEYYEKEKKEKPKQRIELQIEEIVKKWEQGITQEKLSKEYGVSEYIIRKRISEYYEKEEKEKPKKKIELPIEEIVKKWEQGVTQKELSKEYGVSRVTINKRISEYYEKEEKGKPKQRIELPIEEIVKKWEQGTTQEKLSKEYGVSGFTISKRISEYYEKEEKEKPKQRIELPIEEIVKKWERGITQKELSKRYGVSKSTINKRISKYYQKKKRKKNEEKKAKILRNSSIIVEYLRKGLTIEQIESIASKQNIIVPQEVKEKAIQKIEQLKENKTNESNER